MQEKYKILLIILSFLFPTALIYFSFLYNFWYFPAYRFLYLVPIILCSIFFGVDTAVVCFLFSFALFVPVILSSLGQGVSLEIITSMFLLLGVGTVAGIFLKKEEKEATQYSILSCIYQESVLSSFDVSKYLQMICKKLNQIYETKLDNGKIMVRAPGDFEYLQAVEDGVNFYIRKMSLHRHRLSLRDFIQISIDQINYGVLIVKHTGEIIFSNKFFKNMFERTGVENHLRFHTDFEKVSKILKDTSLGYLEERYEINIGDKKHSLIVDAIHIKDSKEVILLIEDITEKERIIAHNDLEKLRGDFIRSVSYRAKTSLTTIVGFISTLLSDKENKLRSDEKMEFYNIVYLECERLIRLVNNIFLFSRIKSSQGVKLENDEINLYPLILQEISFLENFTQHRFSLAKVSNDIILFSDREKLKQAIYNILSSITYFSSTQENISIGLEEKDTSIIISFKCVSIGAMPFEEVDTVPEKNIELFLGKHLTYILGGETYLADDKTTIFVKIPKRRNYGRDKN